MDYTLASFDRAELMQRVRYAAIPMLSNAVWACFFKSSSLEILQFGQYFDVIKGCVSLSIGYVSYLAWMVPFGARICWIGLGGSGEVYTLYPS